MGRVQVLLGWLVLAGFALACSNGPAQTLSHKNWQGSGLTSQPWWAQAVFCSAGSNLERAAREMESLEKIGCDAVEVSPGGGYSAAVEMDAITEAAGRRRMRVVADLDGSLSQQELRERLAFWEARGVSGFAVGGGAEEVVSQLRKANPGRLLICEGGQLAPRQVPEEDATRLRRWLIELGAARQKIVLDGDKVRTPDVQAAILFLTGGPVRIAVHAILPPTSSRAVQAFSAEELLLWVPEAETIHRSASEWIRTLFDLHHDSALFGKGQLVSLNFETSAILGWAVPGLDKRPALVVVCNVEGEAKRLDVEAALKDVGLRWTYLNTVVRSDGMGESLDLSGGVGLGGGGCLWGKFGSLSPRPR